MIVVLLTYGRTSINHLLHQEMMEVETEDKAQELQLLVVQVLNSSLKNKMSQSLTPHSLNIAKATAVSVLNHHMLLLQLRLRIEHLLSVELSQSWKVYTLQRKRLLPNNREQDQRKFHNACLLTNLQSVAVDLHAVGRESAMKKNEMFHSHNSDIYLSVLFYNYYFSSYSFLSL